VKEVKGGMDKKVIVRCTGGGTVEPYGEFSYPLYMRLRVSGTPDDHHLISGFEIHDLEHGYTKFARGQNVLDIIVDADLSIKAVFVPKSGPAPSQEYVLRVEANMQGGTATIFDAQTNQYVVAGPIPLEAKKPSQWVARVKVSAPPNYTPSTFEEVCPVFSSLVKKTYIFS